MLLNNLFTNQLCSILIFPLIFVSHTYLTRNLTVVCVRFTFLRHLFPLWLFSPPFPPISPLTRFTSLLWLLRDKFVEIDLKPVCKHCYERMPEELKRRLARRERDRKKKPAVSSY